VQLRGKRAEHSLPVYLICLICLMIEAWPQPCDLLWPATATHMQMFEKTWENVFVVRSPTSVREQWKKRVKLTPLESPHRGSTRRCARLEAESSENETNIGLHYKPLRQVASRQSCMTRGEVRVRSFRPSVLVCCCSSPTGVAHGCRRGVE
jgi:hypothetical protein